MDALVRNAKPKPERGTFRRELIDRRMKIENKEDAATAAAKKRDGYRCRWPHATALDREVCRRSSWLEAMHFKAKGAGGNKDGSRNVRKNLLTGCPAVHQGPRSIHAGEKRPVPLDPDRLMDGPCAFEVKVGKRRWVEVGREVAVGILEQKRRG